MEVPRSNFVHLPTESQAATPQQRYHLKPFWGTTKSAPGVARTGKARREDPFEISDSLGSFCSQRKDPGHTGTEPDSLRERDWYFVAKQSGRPKVPESLVRSRRN